MSNNTPIACPKCNHEVLIARAELKKTPISVVLTAVTVGMLLPKRILSLKEKRLLKG
jgi:hypothetical protein